MKDKKRKLFVVLAVGIILLIPLLWLQANEKALERKGYPDTGTPKTAIEPPDYHTYPAYAPAAAMRAIIGTTGVVAYSNSNGIALINPSTKRISPIKLNKFNWTIDPETGYPVGGQLGSEGGGRFDVAMNRKGNLALISNFGDRKVYFVNLASGNPVVVGSVQLDFFAEDIDITPSGKWALVSDGGFSPRIAVIHIPTRTWVPAGVDPDTSEPYSWRIVIDEGEDPTDPDDDTVGYANCISIAPDGRTVIVADYFTGAIHVCLLNPTTGALTYRQTERLWKYGTDGTEANVFLHRPVNVAISPDSRVVLLSNATRSLSPYEIDPTDPTQIIEGASVAVFNIDSLGHVIRRPDVIMPYEVGGGQCIVFSRDGTKAYYETIYYIDDDTYDTAQEIQVLSVNAGLVTRTGAIRMQTYRGTSQLFGVDTMATSPDGNYLFVTNPTLSGGQPIIEVADLNTQKPIKQITTPIDYPDPMSNWPDPPIDPTILIPGDFLIPVGIAFPESPIDLALTKTVNKTTPAVGATVTFTVAVTNNSNSPAFDIKISDPLPSGLALVSAGVSLGTYDRATGCWKIFKLGRGSRATLTIRARVNLAGTITNIAQIKHQNGYDPRSGNDSASATITAK